MLRAAAARALRAGPSPLPSGAAPFSVLGFKDVLGAGAAEAATKLKQAVSGAPGVGQAAAAAAAGWKSGAVSAPQFSQRLMYRPKHSTYPHWIAGAMEGGPISSAPEEGPQAVGPAAAGESGGAGAAGCC